MTPQEIAERYADSMSRDANRDLVVDIEEIIRERVAVEMNRCADLVRTFMDPIYGLAPDGPRRRIADAIRSGTPPATEPPNPSPPQSDGG